ncbi:MAG: D-tyrosyl-tRNA(Tyr) deacylase [Spirochaetaceae bacterium]|nr:MAG: D-tyrosyl-tRNA(Tyr) deacylase [Spirochaetaceae bacterium]
MRALLQRVSRASVRVEGHIVGSVRTGLLVLLGVAPEDSHRDLEYLAEKLLSLRIFRDEMGRMNRSVLDVEGSILLVSQFTLYASTRKGRRPYFSGGASPEHARSMYEELARLLATRLDVATGVFGAPMEVELLNDGPVTIMLDSKARE